MDEKEWVLFDCKALGVIKLTLLKLIAFNIKNQNTKTSFIICLTSMYE